VTLPSRADAEIFLHQNALTPFLSEIDEQRRKEIETISLHLEISLETIIDKENIKYANLLMKRETGSPEQGLEGRIKQVEDHLDELNERLSRRRTELDQERNCTIADIHHHGCAWVLPHPQRSAPEMAEMVQDAAIERIAVDTVIAYEEARGCQVISVEAENRGFDLISRRLHPENPDTYIEVRFIEVKGRAGVGPIAVTENEYKTSNRLKNDYWLYVVYNCASSPELFPIQNPAELGWKPVMAVDHYQLSSVIIRKNIDNISESGIDNCQLKG
jgi:hypothetical protein